MMWLAVTWTIMLVPVLQAQFSYSNTNGALTITYYSGPGGDVIIPDAINGLPVARIGSDAFATRGTITSVEIPDSVTSIGVRAFRGCAGMAHVTIGAGVRSIGEEAFFECSSLSHLTIPDAVTSVGPKAFDDCRGLISVSIGHGVTTTSSPPFLHCDSLESIRVDPLNAAFRDEEGVLFNKNRTVLIQYPGSRAGDYVVPTSVTSIGGLAFARSRNLTGVTMPPGLLNLGNAAFLSCEGLTSLILPNGVKSILDSTFSSCSGLLSVTLPDGLTSIAPYAFSDCGSLTSIAIPNSVTVISGSTFRDCHALGSVTVGSGVARIQSLAFFKCTNLTSIELPDGLTSIGDEAFYGCTQLGAVNLPQSLTSIGYEAFRDCARLTSAKVPSKVPSIGVRTFAGCTNLKSVILTGMLGSIGAEAFSGCASLANLSIPGSVVYIGEYAFRGCASLNEITVDPSNISYGDVDGVLFDSTRTTLMVCPARKAGNYVIPNSVTTILSAAFEGCNELLNVTIPIGVAAVGLDSFRGCTKLIAITVDPLNRFLRSVDGVLFDKDATILHQYPAGKQGTFMLPRSLTRLGPSDAFYACTGVDAFTVDPLSTAFSTVDDVVFSKDGSTLLRFPPGRAGNYTMPSKVIAVEGHAFSSCIRLTRLTVPASVRRLGWQALTSCSSLRSVYCEGNAPEFADTCFFQCHPDVLVYYLPGTTGWAATVSYAPAVPTVLWNPRAESPAIVGGRFTFDVRGPRDAIVVVEGSSTLSDAAWSPTTTLTLDSAGFASFRELELSATAGRFYRLGWP